MYLIPYIISDCAKVHQDIPAIREWASLFSDLAWAKITVHYNAVNHMFALTNDYRKMRKDI
jgi:hypothetical protein